MPTNTASLTTVARHFDFVRETEGPNRGAWVSFMQRFCNGAVGDSWCADFVSLVEDIAYHGKPMTPRTGSSHDKYHYCAERLWLVAEPRRDDLFFYINDEGRAHHIGIITGRAQTGVVLAIAGNTSMDGKNVNGDGVYEHAIIVGPHVKFARLPL